MAVVEAFSGSARKGRFNVQVYSKSVSIIFAFIPLAKADNIPRPLSILGKNYPRVRVQGDMDIVSPLVQPSTIVNKTYTDILVGHLETCVHQSHVFLYIKWFLFVLLRFNFIVRRVS